MLVERVINDVSFAVNPSSPGEILFDDITLAKINVQKNITIDNFIELLEEECNGSKPLSLLWHMTRRCNFSCPFCYIRDNSKLETTTFERAKDVLNDMISAGLFRVTLSGGECFLVRDFPKIYRYLKENGVLVTIYTNASLIDENLISLFEELPPFSIEVTFYNSDFSSAPFQNIKNLQRLKTKIKAKFTVTKSTLAHFSSVKHWCEKNCIDFRFDTDLFNGENEVDALSYIVDEKTLLDFDLMRYESYFEKYLEPCAPIIGFECQAVKGSVYISPEFELSLCCNLEMTWPLIGDSFHSAYSKMLTYVHGFDGKELAGCSGCDAYILCKMCFAMAEKRISEKQTYYCVPKGYCKHVKRRYESIRSGLKCMTDEPAKTQIKPIK